jgi:hypothetical protein
MDVIAKSCHRREAMRALVALACLAVTPAYAGRANAERMRWVIEQGVDVPTYATAEPTATDLNIDTVVLACERAGRSRILQLQLYLSDDGRLRPLGVSPAELSDDPRASVSIDAKDYPVSLIFAGDHVLLADGLEGAFPRLSDRLIAAMQTGRTMILKFELLARRPDRSAGFDSQAIVALQAAGAGPAIAAMRHCVDVPERSRPWRSSSG